MADTATAAAALTYQDICARIEEGTPRSLVAGKKVLALTPDATRTAPLPSLVRAVRETIGTHASQLDFMVALGTHPVMPDEQIHRLYGLEADDLAGDFAQCRLLNHRWDQAGTLVRIGSFSESEISDLTQGRFVESVDVTINKAALDYDLILIVGPVFPHEIVGFSGGNKYLFPGISGGDFLDFFHWMSAVNTCMATIGRKATPARQLVDRAAAMVPTARHCVAMVVKSEQELAGLFVGTPEEAWSQAADLSASIHVRHTGRQYSTVFGHAPRMYDEMWVAGKVMYKLEPVVADGGELIIYGPHIKQISATWGTYLEELGYHVADYFLADPDAFKKYPRGVLAHSALVTGVGTYSDGVERPRIRVRLATSLSEQMCRSVNLEYADYRELDPAAYRHREQDGVLYVDHAGEILHLPD